MAQASLSNPRSWVIEKLETIFGTVIDDLQEQKFDTKIPLSSRDCFSHPSPGEAQEVVPTLSSPKSRELAFPGVSSKAAWRFTVLLRVLGLIYEAVMKGVVISKRELYYRDPTLFVKQTVVDNCVDEIARTWKIPRALLHVAAAAKGLFAGCLTITRTDGSVIERVTDREGMLVLSNKDIKSIDLRQARWILVVEKETIFKSLTVSAQWPVLSKEGILITGKGYPDIATRDFLRLLALPSLRNGYRDLPVHGLVDFDPDGIAILSVYKHGSIALTHYNAELIVPKLSWLGIRSSELLSCHCLYGESNPLTLSLNDRCKATNILLRCIQSPSNADVQMSRELQMMLMLNAKAETECLHMIYGGIGDFVCGKLVLE